MIGKLCGTVESVGSREILIMVGGVGYVLHVATSSLASLHESPNREVCLFTYLAVRENSLDLYGFISEREKELFMLLIGVSGIGPKSAISILSVTDVATLEKAVLTQDASYLTKVSGVGKKNAEKIVLELKDKISGTTDTSDPLLSTEGEALEALLALGYSQREAKDALTMSRPGVMEDASTTSSVSTRVTLALRFLGSK
jgi:Holliday junction DNA helicase RuvA